jgi:hypothetical protein
MRQLISYYSLVVKTAFRHSIHHTQAILFVLFIVTGAAVATAKHIAPAFAAMIPNITTWQIAAITLGALIVTRLLLAPYWLYKEQAAKLRSIDHEKSEKSPPKIEICFDKGAPYEVSNVDHHHVLSTVSIGLKNSGSPLPNCKVFIEKISPEPPLAGGLPILLEGGGFTLRNDEPEKVIDVAAHWDHVDKYRFNAPHGHFAETFNYIDDKELRTIVIKVEASGYQRSASFRIWTDNARALHLEYIGYVN